MFLLLLLITGMVIRVGNITSFMLTVNFDTNIGLCLGFFKMLVHMQMLIVFQIK